jgi:GrpB-like predicted nucleotidyltransferase (UPF0157 family)
VSGSSDLIEIVEYDPSWAARFEEEKPRLAGVFDGRAVGIEHIGSTAVPHLCAKPIVDILVGLGELDLTDDDIAAMKELGYEHMGELGIAGRVFFRKGQPRTHNVHVVEHGGAHWRRHLAFRDALRSDPEERRRYDELKRRLAAEGHSREVYTELKTPFIREVEARARARGVRPTS